MAAAYSVTCAVASEWYETAVAQLCMAQPLGWQEESIADGVRIKAMFPAVEAAQGWMAALGAIQLIEPAETSLIEDKDWNATWRASIEPVKLTDSVWVAPAWRPPRQQPGEHWIRIEPKMMFGTGHHATTKLAARLLEQNAARYRGGAVLDVGCGTAILCFAADLFGAQQCVGVDIDVGGLAAVADNFNDNATQGVIGVVIGTLDALRAPQVFDCGVINMLSFRSDPLLPQVFSLLKPRATCIRSGILIEERDEVVRVTEQQGFSLLREQTLEEWWGGVFQKRW